MRRFSRFFAARRRETLRVFFGIPQVRIDRDVREAFFDAERIVQEIIAYDALGKGEQTAERTASCYHNQLLMAHFVRKIPRVSEEEAVFYVATAVEAIVNEAADDAMERGRVGELTREMKLIERREGLGPKEFWSLGEGPADYQAAVAESEELPKKIDETIFVHVLGRYRFAAALELYEKRRMEFAVMREVGRRVVVPGQSMKVDMEEEMSGGGFFRIYGEAGVDLLRERLKENEGRGGG